MFRRMLVAAVPLVALWTALAVVAPQVGAYLNTPILRLVITYGGNNPDRTVDLDMNLWLTERHYRIPAPDRFDARPPLPSPDGQYRALRVSGGDMNTLWVNTDAEQRHIATAEMFTHLAWSGDGAWLVYTVWEQTDTKTLFLARPDGGTPRMVMGNINALRVGEGWLAFTQSNGDLYAMPFGDDEPHFVAANAHLMPEQTWSPTEATMLYVSDPRGDATLHMLDLATFDAMNLGIGPVEERRVFWSPDGARVASASFQDGEVFVSEVSTGHTQRLSSEGVPTILPVDGWMPDSARLVLVEGFHDYATVKTVDVVTGAQRHIADLRHAQFYSFWLAPNGRWLAFTRTAAGDTDIVVLNMRRGTQRVYDRRMDRSSMPIGWN